MYLSSLCANDEGAILGALLGLGLGLKLGLLFIFVVVLLFVLVVESKSHRWFTLLMLATFGRIWPYRYLSIQWTKGFLCFWGEIFFLSKSPHC